MAVARLRGIIRAVAAPASPRPSSEEYPPRNASAQVRGEACRVCGGARVVEIRREVIVEVPPGAPDGHEVTFRNLGDEHPDRATGDLVVTVLVAEHAVFSRSEAAPENVVCNSSVGLLHALLGFEKRLTGLGGSRVSVQHSRVAFGSFAHHIPGEGLPIFGNASAPVR